MKSVSQSLLRLMLFAAVMTGLIFMVTGMNHAAQTKKTTTKPLTTKTKKSSKPTTGVKPNLVVEDISLDRGFITFRLKNKGPGSLPDEDHKQGEVKVSYKSRVSKDTYPFSKIDPKRKLKKPDGSVTYKTREKLTSRQEVTVLVYFRKKTLKPVKKISLKRTLGKKQGHKIQNFLTVVEKAQTFKQIAISFKNSHFTKDELSKLEKEMKKSRYSTKLEQLKLKLAASSKSDKRRIQKNKKSDLSAMKASINRKQNQAMEKLNLHAAKFLKNKQNSMVFMPNRYSAARVIRAPESIQSTRGSIIRDSQVEVSRLTPRNGIIGQTLVIRGTGFGNQPGRVSIAIIDPENRIALDGNIRTWTNNRIELTIPLDFESYVEFTWDGEGTRPAPVSEAEASAAVAGDSHVNGDEEAWLAIFPAGDDPGTRLHFTITLDPDRFVPSISSLSSNEISPGQVLVITGNNLAPAGAPPVVTFIFGRHLIDRDQHDLEEVADNHISLLLSEHLGGMFEIPGRVEVRTALGHTVQHPVTFIPAEELIEIRSEEMEVRCKAWHPKPFCFTGQAEQFTQHDWILLNGWTVETSWLETETAGPNAGAYYTRQPEPGSAVAKSIIEVWADAYSIAVCHEVFVIKGPKGTFDQCR